MCNHSALGLLIQFHGCLGIRTSLAEPRETGDGFNPTEVFHFAPLPGGYRSDFGVHSCANFLRLSDFPIVLALFPTVSPPPSPRQ